MGFSPIVALASDLAMCWLDYPTSHGREWLLLSSDPIYVREMLSRCPAGLLIAVENHTVEQAAGALLANRQSPELVTVRNADEADFGSGQCRAALWALPQRTSSPRRLRLLDAAGPDRLVVFGPGLLAKLLGSKRRPWLVGQGISELLPGLSKVGYTPSRQCSIGQPLAVLWAALASAAAAAWRQDLVDRCEAAFRFALIPPSRSGPGLLDVCMLTRASAW